MPIDAFKVWIGGNPVGSWGGMVGWHVGNQTTFGGVVHPPNQMTRG